MDTRLLVYDPGGRVIFDTKGVATNQDFSKWTDVRHALDGQYGSRWELDKPHQRVNIYSTLPVFVGGKIVGAVSVSKSTNRIRNFISRSLENLLLPGLIALLLATAMAYALSAYITRIIWDLASRAERIAAGEGNVRLETWTRSELGTLARAVERMRERLEGKAYVEEMATNLSHELKTPLATIRGSAELLEGVAGNDPAARAEVPGEHPDRGRAARSDCERALETVADRNAAGGRTTRRRLMRPRRPEKSARFTEAAPRIMASHFNRRSRTSRCR